MCVCVCARSRSAFVLVPVRLVPGCVPHAAPTQRPHEAGSGAERRTSGARVSHPQAASARRSSGARAGPEQGPDGCSSSDACGDALIEGSHCSTCVALPTFLMAPSLASATASQPDPSHWTSRWRTAWGKHMPKQLRTAHGRRTRLPTTRRSHTIIPWRCAPPRGASVNGRRLCCTSWLRTVRAPRAPTTLPAQGATGPGDDDDNYWTSYVAVCCPKSHWQRAQPQLGHAPDVSSSSCHRHGCVIVSVQSALEIFTLGIGDFRDAASHCDADLSLGILRTLSVG